MPPRVWTWRSLKLAGLNLQQAVDKLQADLLGTSLRERYGIYFRQVYTNGFL
ncbi:hypothetical protein [Neomoorella mulderi]|nr:hypothetical protein [Moorella mulderi]